MLRTTFFTGAAYLYQSHDMAVNREHITEAARACLRYGYGHQAQEMQKLRDLHRLLPGDLYTHLLVLAQHG